MKILMLGDVNGSPGRRMIAEHVKRLRSELGLAAVIANAENAAAGNGLNAALANTGTSLGISRRAHGGRRPGLIGADVVGRIG